MRIINYKINKLIYIKTQITKLTPVLIENNSNQYYFVLSSVVSSIPDDTMFIPETLLIAPHSSEYYTPKLVKIGATFSGSMNTKLPKGIEIKILVFDNIDNKAFTITDTSTFKANEEKNSNISHNTHNMMKIDSDSIMRQINDQMDDNVRENESERLLDIIDSKIGGPEELYEDQEVDSRVKVREDNTKPIITYEMSTNPTTSEKIVASKSRRSRGRPKKNSVNKAAQEEMKDLLVPNNEEDNKE